MGTRNGGVTDNGNANELADYILQKLPKKKFDPLPLKLSTDNLKISDGEICGLSSVRRYGDCTFHGGHKETNVILNLEASQLSVQMKYKVKVGLLWIKGELSAVVNQVAIRLDVTMEDEKMSLNSLEVLKLEGYRIVKLTGLSKAFNWMLQFIVNGLLYTFKQKLVGILVNEGKEAMQKLIDQIPLSKL